MDKFIMEMIATDILPYAVVEGVGFKRLLAKAEHRFTPKSKKYFRTRLMGEMYSQVAKRVKELLSVEKGTALPLPLTVGLDQHTGCVGVKAMFEPT